MPDKLSLLCRAGDALPPPALALARDEVHVWRLALKPAASHPWAAEDLLSPDESARARAFRFSVDREHWIVARAWLRTTLARYLRCEPGELAFRYGPHGKPALAPGCGGPLAFNLTHTADLALLAVSRGREVGIDVERVQPMPDLHQLAAGVFTPREWALFDRLPPTLRHEAFLRCWTRKEAYAKARGEGLALGLSGFEVAFLPDAPPALLTTPDDARELSRWAFHNLRPGAGYVGALVVENVGRTCDRAPTVLPPPDLPV
jgi:4'-phosphopantetheinyl transferase